MESSLLDLFQELEIVAKLHGVNIRAYNSPDIQSQISDHDRKFLEKSISGYIEIMRDPEVTDSKTFHSFLQQNGFQTQGDFTEKFDDGDIVEVYDAQGTQLFRNLTFFKHCGYTLADLFLTPFIELYSRDIKYDQQIVEFFTVCFENPKGVVPCGVEPHYLKEKRLNRRESFFITPKWACPIFRDDVPVALAFTIHAEARILD